MNSIASVVTAMRCSRPKSTSRRSSCPMAVPPGSVVGVTGTFCPRSQSTRSRHWVDFPVPSRPSSERNTGVGMLRIRIHHKGTKSAQRTTKGTEFNSRSLGVSLCLLRAFVVNCLLPLDPSEHLSGGQRVAGQRQPLGHGAVDRRGHVEGGARDQHLSDAVALEDAVAG